LGLDQRAAMTQATASEMMSLAAFGRLISRRKEVDGVLM
jgi:hypothetical protein